MRNRLPAQRAAASKRAALQNELFAARRSLKMATDAADGDWIKRATTREVRAQQALETFDKEQSK